MKSLHNSYVQVDKEVFDEIKEMRRKQDEIPHYKAKLKEIEGFKSLSKMDMMKLAKYNVDEIKKQYDNEDQKGMIFNNGHTRSYNEKKYVVPILDHLFDLNGLAEFVNEKQTNMAKKYLKDEELERHMVLCGYIRFIRDSKVDFLISLTHAKSAEDMKIKYKIYYGENGYGFEEIKGIMFWVENDKGVAIYNCKNSQKTVKYFSQKDYAKADKEAEKHWYCQIGHKKFPLSIWKELEGNVNF